MSSEQSREREDLDTMSNSDLDLVTSALEPAELAPNWRIRLLGDVTPIGRFERFALDVAELLGVDVAVANQYLDWLGDARRWSQGLFPRMELIHLEHGSNLGPALAGFVRLAAGTVFPEHQHLGRESVLIMQGSCDDSGQILRPGERKVSAAGSGHSFVVRPGPDLLYLAVVQNGLRIGERDFLAEDASSLF